MNFPARPWAWDAGGIPSGSYGLPPDPVPDDPVKFLDNCSSWWHWLEGATPEELDAYARTGRIPYPLEALARDLRRMRDATWSEVIVPDTVALQGAFRPRAMFEVVRD